MSAFFYILLLAFLPLVYKIWFWLYVVQLKEYRFDRIYEYLFTPQWRKAILNILFYIELIVLILWVLFFLWKISNTNMYYIFVFFLQFESLYVFYKLFKRWLFLPKKTWRIFILSLLVILWLISIFTYLYFYQTLIYLVVPFLFSFFFLYVFFWNFITSSFFDLKKEQIFKKAGKKTKNLEIKKIWITWSYGKSSVKEFLSTLLWEKYKVLKTPKNINTEMWISNLILKTDFLKYDIFVSEMWAYRKWEIHQAWEILNHQDAFVSAVWNQHIWLFGSQQNILDAKFEIWEKVLENKWKLYANANLKPLDWKIIINWEKYNIPVILQKLLDNKQVIFYWMWENIDYSINIQKIEINGTYFRFYKKWEDLFKKDLFVKILWKWQIENLCGTLGYLLENKFSLTEIENGLKNISQIDKSLKIIEKKLWVELDWQKEEKIIYIDDSYNLSVNGLLNWIDLMNRFDWKKFLVMDDILELWTDASNIHYELWKKLVWKIDMFLFVGVNYKQDIVKWLKDNNFEWEILEKFPPYFVESTIVLLEGKKAWRYLKAI
jgi:UDP-N-acetylmuramoyl-tripeptide--D-alanyl-D-alanine ligase